GFPLGWCSIRAGASSFLTLFSTTPLPSIHILFLWPPWHLHPEAKHL
ncbi:hypothetical protein AYX14_06651, partial [Cryptococcus neoformans]